ncbi:MAG: M28 family peptidase [Sutterellaceae bacterium]|nr:M28 family peptidase [Sutterellaceae bacterium]
MTELTFASNQELATALSQVDGERLLDTVAVICTGERLSNAAEEASFTRMRALYEACGCRTHLERLLAYVSTPEKAELTVAGKPFAAITHAMTPSVEGLSAQTVYVAADAVGDTDARVVAGKIVLTDGLAMEPVVRALQTKGALGAIFITGQFVHNMIVSRVWGSPTPETMHDYVTIPVVSVSYADGQAIKALVENGAEATMTTVTNPRWVEIPVLVAELGNCTNEFVMVTGHNDSWHLGAMDNASGNACAIELARIFSTRQSEMRRGLRFVTWSGHSHGRYAGSAAYCDEHFPELSEKCVLNINADCLGGCGASLLTQSPAMACTDDLARSALKIAAGVTDWEGTRFSRSCDQSFWGAGVPSIFSQVSEQPPVQTTAAKAFQAMFGGAKSGGYGYWWHSTEDTIDKLDGENLKRDTQIFLATAWSAVMQDSIPVSALSEANELLACVTDWQKKGASAVDLTGVTEQLKDIVVKLKTLEEATRAGKISVLLRNRRVMSVLRELIRLRYVKGSIYKHDAACRQKDVPMLSLIDDFNKCDDMHYKNCVRIALKREVNRMTMGLKRALAALS